MLASSLLSLPSQIFLLLGDALALSFDCGLSVTGVLQGKPNREEASRGQERAATHTCTSGASFASNNTEHTKGLWEDQDISFSMRACSSSLCLVISASRACMLCSRRLDASSRLMS